MKKSKGNWKKRILSVALALAMVVTMISVADWSAIVNAAAPAQPGETIIYGGNSAQKIRTRAMLDAFPLDTSEDDWLATWRSKERGTAERPFVVVEIVPYYEQASFGYLIEGCEPFDYSPAYGDQDFYTSDINGEGAFGRKVEINEKTKFFPEEAEGQREFYRWSGTNYRDDVATWNGRKKVFTGDNSELVYGYYERVEKGSGTFYIAESDDHVLSIEPANNSVESQKGTLVWHTVNNYLKDIWTETGYDPGDTRMNLDAIWAQLATEHPDYTNEQIKAQVESFLFNTLKLNQIGARYFTQRVADKDNSYYEIPAKYLWRYESYDLFARDTLGLSKKEAAKYSIWYKAITPFELNANPEWADIADLVFVCREDKHMNVDLFKKSQPYYRLDRTFTANAFIKNNCCFAGTYSSSDYGAAYAGVDKDISYEVMIKLFERVAAPTDYVGIVWDQTWAKDMTTKSVTHYVYDLSNNRVTGKSSTNTDMNWDGNQPGHRYNIGKLYVMCTTLRSNLIQRFFLETHLIEKGSDGKATFSKNSNRAADESTYWNGMNFYIGYQAYGNVAPQKVDSDTTYWEDYNGFIDYLKDPIYVQGHCYTYNGNQAIHIGFEGTGSAGVGADGGRYSDFANYLATDETTQQIWASLGGTADDYNTEEVSPWAALRYILDLTTNQQITGEIYVLDIEPSVGLGTDRRPNWKLTANDVALMIPDIAAKTTIKINHMISGSFVGRNEDLNSTYDLIYIGDDASGFWSGNDVKTWSSYNSNWSKSRASAGADRTDFVDDAMDGQVYFHIGDLYTVSTNFRPNFMYNVAEGQYNYTEGNEHVYDTKGTTRQPGNDFTSIKVGELSSYVNAGYPVVAARNLYTTGNYPYVDQGSYVWSFLSTKQAQKNSDNTYSDGVFMSNQVTEISKRVLLRKLAMMKISSSPIRYDSANKEGTYLPKDGVYGLLKFTVEVPSTSGYAYRIYLDQDRNGKFDAYEIVQANNLSALVSNLEVHVTDGWVGFIQWKIEVYKTSNEDCRISESGCSAIKAKETEKNKILALQIVPNSGSDVHLYTHKGNGDKITNNRNWTDLYDFCTDFEIEVYEVMFKEFEEFFKDARGNSYGFTYDMSKDINISETDILSNTNPRRDVLDKVEKQTEREDLKTKYLGGHTLSEFNMIVIGFKDSYGSQDFSNKYGCAEYLFYFADKGKSLLFTHDLAHYRNEMNWDIGRSATTMLRDIMGMNRYGVVNYRLVNDVSADHNFNADKSGNLARNLSAYNTKKGIPFETSKDDYKQAYTYANLSSKVGQGAGGNRRTMYKYQCINPQTGAANTLNDGKTLIGAGGNIGNALSYTDRVKKLNEGQITQYPFNIKSVLPVNSTHYQYYQLNMEDPELTVWFTLEDPYVNGSNASESGGRYELIYGVTPQEAANNYYIYSKGNIFYSGVGHSGISGVDERQLFVNTLIAAYRPTLQEPEIIITNVEATRNGKTYTIRIDQEFDYDEAGNRIASAAMDGEVEVFFIPRDYSGAPNLKCRIYYEGEDPFFGDNEPYLIYKATLNADGQKVRGARLTSSDKVPGVPNTFVLNTEQEYCIVYQKSRIAGSAEQNHIIFEAKNDRVESPSYTNLYFKPRPLFVLD